MSKDNRIITSAGLLLDEVRSIQASFGTSRPLADAVPLHFSLGDRIPWQVGVLRFNRTIDRAIQDLDIVQEERRDRYMNTLDGHVRSLVSLKRMSSDTNSVVTALLTELTIERLENFHDSLVLAGRSYSVEKSRVNAATAAIQELIDEIGLSSTEIDAFVVEKLTDLLIVLGRYELFGPEGVRDYVNDLVGSTMTRILEIRGPVPDQIKERALKVLGVSKGVMDAFVYLATGAQAIEWMGAHLALLGGPASPAS